MCLKILESHLYCKTGSNWIFNKKRRDECRAIAREVMWHRSRREMEIFGLTRWTVDEQVHQVLSINGYAVANTNSNLEIALADLALSGISPDQRYADVLIGGLGLGATLRQVLKHRAVQSVCVVEIEPQIVEWNRTFLTNADLLDDARGRAHCGRFLFLCARLAAQLSRYCDAH